MTPERFQQIRRVFESVIELTASARETALLEAESEDPALAFEVRHLVSAYERRDDFINRPVLDMRPASPAAGPYQLLNLIGEGGMGEVWRASQAYPVLRIVAVKLIKAGMDTREVVARFESERQALALMDHPAIAKVFDAGSTSEGRPYFVMELVRGVKITAYCDQHKLSITERLRLFVQVCHGVQHAHQKAIIHRDLKPSNILVAEVDGRPVPKIIDFGVAKAVSQSLAETLFTRAGAILGTPDYMSPEQARSAGEDIDTRADVYSLGVLLYELLVGALPLDLRSLTLHQVLRELQEANPPRPSTRIRNARELLAAAGNRGAHPAAFTLQLRGDLDAIALKALEKDRARRYSAPSELAHDIERYIRSEPISARPAGVAYQAGKYIRRHRTAVAVAAALVLVLVAFAGAEAIQLNRITRERDRADRVTTFMTSMFSISNPSESQGNKVTAREILDKASREIGTGLGGDPELQAQMMDVMGTVYYKLGLYSRSESLLRQTLDTRRRGLGSHHPRTAQAMSDLANTLDREGRHDEAEALDREALALRTKLYGIRHPDTLRSMNHVAAALHERGRYTEAEQLHRQVFEIRRALLGPEHPDTLTSMDNLGSTLDAEGRFTEAENLERGALNIKQRVLGPLHPETARAMHHLADTLYEEGRYPEAEKLHRQVVHIRTRVLGPRHSETLDSVLGLANSLEGQRRYAEAEKLDRTAFDSERSVLGAEHPHTLTAGNNLAEVLAEEGKYQDAEALHRDIAALRFRVLGPEHPHTLYSESKLASVLILEGKFQEAEKLTRAVRAIQIRRLGPDHPDTAASTSNLAAILAHTGQHQEAILLLREAIGHGLKPADALGLDKDLRYQQLYAEPDFKALMGDIRRQAEQRLQH